MQKMPSTNSYPDRRLRKSEKTVRFLSPSRRASRNNEDNDENQRKLFGNRTSGGNSPGHSVPEQQTREGRRCNSPFRSLQDHGDFHRTRLCKLHPLLCNAASNADAREKYGGQLRVVFYDIGQDDTPAGTYGIQVIPTLVASWWRSFATSQPLGEWRKPCDLAPRAFCLIIPASGFFNNSA